MIALHGIMIAKLGAMKQDRKGSRVDPLVRGSMARGLWSVRLTNGLIEEFVSDLPALSMVFG